MLLIALIGYGAGLGLAICLVLGLCAAARDGDRQLEAACRRQERCAASQLRPRTGLVEPAPRRRPHV